MIVSGGSQEASNSRPLLPRRCTPGPAASGGGQQTAEFLAEAPEYYTELCWVVHAFPWVVGVRGMINPGPLCALFPFLEIPKKHWQPAIERTVLASVLRLAFYFLHNILFGCSKGADLPELGSSEQGDEEVCSDPKSGARK